MIAIPHFGTDSFRGAPPNSSGPPGVGPMTLDEYCRILFGVKKWRVTMNFVSRQQDPDNEWDSIDVPVTRTKEFENGSSYHEDFFEEYGGEWGPKYRPGHEGPEDLFYPWKWVNDPSHPDRVETYLDALKHLNIWWIQSLLYRDTVSPGWYDGVTEADFAMDGYWRWAPTPEGYYEPVWGGGLAAYGSVHTPRKAPTTEEYPPDGQPGEYATPAAFGVIPTIQQTEDPPYQAFYVYPEPGFYDSDEPGKYWCPLIMAFDAWNDSPSGYFHNMGALGPMNYPWPEDVDYYGPDTSLCKLIVGSKTYEIPVWGARYRGIYAGEDGNGNPIYTFPDRPTVTVEAIEWWSYGGKVDTATGAPL